MLYISSLWAIFYKIRSQNIQDVYTCTSSVQERRVYLSRSRIQTVSHSSRANIVSNCPHSLCLNEIAWKQDNILNRIWALVVHPSSTKYVLACTRSI
jgi:hypothetical protein